MTRFITSINPTTGKKIEQYPLADNLTLENTLKKSQTAFKHLKSTSIKERCNSLKKLANLLRKHKQELAITATLEMGKPITQSLAEVEKCAWVCEYYSEKSPKFLSPEIVRTEAKKSYIRFDPLGSILCIMPWNFPFWQVFRFSAPAFAAGNSIILKHSSVVPACSLLIEQLFTEATSSSIFQSVITDSYGVSELIPKVHGVSLTGSVEAGIKVASLASSNLKPFVLELGGSDPFIVLKDADLELAAQNAVQARFINSGQSCIAAKRFIVAKKNTAEFTRHVLKHTKELKVGDPLEKDTQLGPLVQKKQVSFLHNQVKNSVKEGAHIIYGGKPVKRPGFFYHPTIMTRVHPEMRVASEETFGPVLPIISAKTEHEALSIANSTAFGLGASIWSRDRKRAEKLAAQCESGFVAINSVVKSDPRLPFGGIKNSGVGRELSRYGILEFVNIKSVVIQ